MRIIISPAKKMNIDTDSLPYQELPAFVTQTEKLLEQLRQMDMKQLKALWKCSDKLTQASFEQLETINLYQNLTPAILAYDGIQYQYMAPGVLSEQELCYIQEHLRILSGFYGILKPFDGVSPYRLEMQAKLSVEGKKDLYDFWGGQIANVLFEETDTVLNLASQEYSRCVSRYVPENAKLVTCVFGQLIDEKVIEKGTLCKMARGEMVRFLAENSITRLEEVKEFTGQGYCFSKQHSDESHYVFLKQQKKKG